MSFSKRFGDPEGFKAPQRGPAQGLGSGFILDEAGYVVTNHHVIDDASKVTVRLADDRSFEAEVIGSDPLTDIAVLKIDGADDLQAVDLGDSDVIRVGEDVVAIGNPFGLSSTVTTGIVSAKGRNISQGPYAEFLQTDAAINKGNSGGPLFNMDGEVVGVNSAIYSPSGGSVGLGFAVTSKHRRTYRRRSARRWRSQPRMAGRVDPECQPRTCSGSGYRWLVRGAGVRRCVGQSGGRSAAAR